MPKHPRFLREPAGEYHARRVEYFTSHQLADYRRCPALLRKKRSGLVPQWARDELRIGAAAHCLTLEGQRAFESQYVIGGPINPKTGRAYGEETKKFAEWRATQHREVLSDDEHALVCQLAYSVRVHPVASLLLACGTAEGVVREQYLGIACQIRVDWFWYASDETHKQELLAEGITHECGLCDLKTCRNLDDFQGDIDSYGYRHQMAFYRSILYAQTGCLYPVHLIAVEKQEPYRCGVWRLDEHRLNLATAENGQAMRELQVSLADDVWPTRYESLQVA